VGLLKKKIRKLVENFNILSLDVVSGACAGMYFFTDMMRISLFWYHYLLLGMAVWTIYTFDHLLDARKVYRHALTKRHRFHQEHFRGLVGALGAVGIAGLLLAFRYLRATPLLEVGLLVFLLIVLIMLALHWGGERTAVAKEFSIAGFYVAGVVLAPFLRHDFEFAPHPWLVYVLAYFLLAWYNLVYLSFLDGELDQAEGHHSIATVLGKNKTRNLLWVLSLLGLGYAVFLFSDLSSYYHRYTLIWALMLLVHVISFVERPENIASARRRLEASFSFPLVLLLV
jgi:hypothetical protein